MVPAQSPQAGPRPLRRQTLDLWTGLLVWTLALALVLLRHGA